MFRTLGLLVTKQMLPKCWCSTALSAQKVPILLKLSAEFDDVSYILSVIEKEEVKNIPFENWKNRINLLKSYDFKDAECFKMISKYPPLINIDFENMKRTVKSWFDCEFGLNNFRYILYTRPQLLELNESDIKTRIPYLKFLYKSNVSLVTLLEKNPNIMFDDWEPIVKKFDFLIKEKGIERGMLLKTEALTKSLEFLELRFLILEKCGIFKKPETLPHKKRKYGTSSHKNPSLNAIVDFNDELFSNQVANISSEEYYVCSDLFYQIKYKNSDNDEDE